MSYRSLSFFGLFILSLVIEVEPNDEYLTLVVLKSLPDRGSSRAYRANLDYSKHPWHMVAWSSRESGSGSYPIGNVIALNEEYLMMNYVTDFGEDHRAFKYRYAALRTPRTFELSRGLNWDGITISYNYTVHSPNSNLAIFRMSYGSLNHKFMKLKIKGPKLAFNLDKTNARCRAYAWTSEPYPFVDGIAIDGAKLEKERKMKFPNSVESDVRYYSSFDVDINCNSASCQVNTDIAHLCPRDRDFAVPVLCGKDKVLTYVLQFPDNSNYCSNKNIKASHVSSVLGLLDPKVINELK